MNFTRLSSWFGFYYCLPWDLRCLILPPTFALLFSDRTSVVKIWCTSQIEASTTPRETSRAFELLKIGLFNFLSSGQKSRSNAPPIVTEIPLLKDKFRLQSNTVHACQREICRNDTFKLHLKTVLSALFTNKGEILPWKSVKPCKNRKTHGHITLELEIKLVHIPHPSKATFKFPLPRHDTQSNARGGDLEASDLTGT